jgi:uridine kinase
MLDGAFVDIAALVDRIRRAAGERPRVFVGIDGPGASGKSTFARLLSAEMPDACVVHVDDFYFPSSRRSERLGETGALFDLPRLAAQVTAPGSTGEEVRYQRYDWTRDEPAEWIEIPAGAPVIVEGVFCLAAELRAAYTFGIWCAADPKLRLERGVARDGEEARSTWTDVWMPAEIDYALNQRPDLTADLVVDSSDGGSEESRFRVIRDGAARG